MSAKQKTIKYSVSCTGVGLHTGVQSTITFHPAEENSGIKFIRNDKGDKVVTPDIDNVVDLTRGTTIEENGIRVHTTEHVMSACAGMRINNLLIELNSKEPPVMDGSAKDFVSALKLCKRRRIGPTRPESNRELFYKKDMGILARGGFSFDLSKRVLDLDAEEFKKLIKII